jgi:hypothetical protein
VTAIIIDKTTNQVLDIRCERVESIDDYFFTVHFKGVILPRYFPRTEFRLAGTTY